MELRARVAPHFFVHRKKGRRSNAFLFFFFLFLFLFFFFFFLFFFFFFFLFFLFFVFLFFFLFLFFFFFLFLFFFLFFFFFFFFFFSFFFFFLIRLLSGSIFQGEISFFERKKRHETFFFTPWCCRQKFVPPFFVSGSPLLSTPPPPLPSDRIPLSAYEPTWVPSSHLFEKKGDNRQRLDGLPRPSRFFLSFPLVFSISRFPCFLCFFHRICFFHPCLEPVFYDLNSGLRKKIQPPPTSFSSYATRKEAHENTTAQLQDNKNTSRSGPGESFF